MNRRWVSRRPAADLSRSWTVALREVAVLIVVAAIFFSAEGRFGVLGAHAPWMLRRDRDLDEVTVAVLGVLLVSAVMSWRRYHQFVVEKRAAAAARRDLAITHERHRSLFDYHPQAVVSFDLAGHITQVNAASERVTGRSSDDLLGRPFHEILAPEHLEPAVEAFARALGKEAVQLESVIEHQDGSHVDIDVTGLPIVIDDEVVGIYGIVSDITPRKRLERDLVRAQVEADQANEAKSLFLANVSHEIRTPLTTMLGNFELLEDTELDEDQARFVDNMHRSGDRLLSLVTDILDFSRVEAGAVSLARKPLDVRRVVDDVAAAIRPAAEEKGLYFQCAVDPDLPDVLMGDSARLAQVLGELVDNAVKFTDTGWVRLTLDQEASRRGRARVRCAVADSGIGIAEGDRDLVFQAFRQLDPSATRRHGGTGLGLACCRQVVVMMGGRITVESEPGRGSVFTFTIELDEPRGGDTTPPPAAELSRTSRRHDAGESGLMPYS